MNPPPDPEDIQTFPFEPGPISPLVFMGPDGTLVYKSYSTRGDRVLDWSKVGYKQSDVPVPWVPDRDRVAESGKIIGSYRLIYSLQDFLY